MSLRGICSFPGFLFTKRRCRVETRTADACTLNVARPRSRSVTRRNSTARKFPSIERKNDFHSRGGTFASNFPKFHCYALRDTDKGRAKEKKEEKTWKRKAERESRLKCKFGRRWKQWERVTRSGEDIKLPACSIEMKREFGLITRSSFPR